MKAKCPKCQSAFQIKEEKIPAQGARIKCSNCQSIFVIRKPGTAAKKATAQPKAASPMTSAQDKDPLAAFRVKPGGQNTGAMVDGDIKITTGILSSDESSEATLPPITIMPPSTAQTGLQGGPAAGAPFTNDPSLKTAEVPSPTFPRPGARPAEVQESVKAKPTPVPGADETPSNASISFPRPSFKPPTGAPASVDGKTALPIVPSAETHEDLETALFGPTDKPNLDVQDTISSGRAWRIKNKDGNITEYPSLKELQTGLKGRLDIKTAMISRDGEQWKRLDPLLELLVTQKMSISGKPATGTGKTALDTTRIRSKKGKKRKKSPVSYSPRRKKLFVTVAVSLGTIGLFFGGAFLLHSFGIVDFSSILPVEPLKKSHFTRVRKRKLRKHRKHHLHARHGTARVSKGTVPIRLSRLSTRALAVKSGSPKEVKLVKVGHPNDIKAMKGATPENTNSTVVKENGTARHKHVKARSKTRRASQNDAAARKRKAALAIAARKRKAAAARKRRAAKAIAARRKAEADAEAAKRRAAAKASTLKLSSAKDYYKAGMAAFKTGNYRQAATYLTQATKKKRNYTSAYLYLFKALSKTGSPKAKAADRNYRKLKHVASGNRYLKKNIFMRAIGEFSLAIESDPRYAPAYCGIAKAHKKMGNDEPAKRALMQCKKYGGR